MANDLELLGVSQAELREMAIERAAQKLVEGLNDYEDDWARPIKAAIAQAVSDKVDALAEQQLTPLVGGLIENFVLQETNKWGERVGNSVTFTEYLVQRAENWMKEPVNFKGKNKTEEGGSGYGWQANTTRLGYMIHEHLQYQIDNAVKLMLQNANASLADSLRDAVVIQLNDISKKLKIKVDA